MEEQERRPFAVSTTPMERHIEQLVEHLRHREDTRSGFAVAVEAALSHAHGLETRCFRLVRENRELRDAMSTPPLSYKTVMRDYEPLAIEAIRMFEWRLTPFLMRWPVREWESESESFWRRVRWQSYRAAVKTLRALFDENFKQFRAAHRKTMVAERVRE